MLSCETLSLLRKREPLLLSDASEGFGAERLHLADLVIAENDGVVDLAGDGDLGPGGLEGLRHPGSEHLDAEPVIDFLDVPDLNPLPEHRLIVAFDGAFEGDIVKELGRVFIRSEALRVKLGVHFAMRRSGGEADLGRSCRGEVGPGKGIDGEVTRSPLEGIAHVRQLQTTQAGASGITDF